MTMTAVRLTETKPIAQDAIALYLALEWGKEADYDANTWQRVFANSQCITAYANDRLVGLLRYLTDGYHDTQICECVVLPEYQKQGIGTQMMDRLIELYGHTNIYGASLNNAAEFFNKRGLQSREKMITVSRKAA